MRPKSPFLQNLRKRKPEPKMSKKVQERKARASSPAGFNQFNVRGVSEEFVEFKMENPVAPEEVGGTRTGWHRRAVLDGGWCWEARAREGGWLKVAASG